MILWLKRRFDIWTFLAAVVVAGGGILLLGLAILFLPTQPPVERTPLAIMTVFPAPTATSTPDVRKTLTPVTPPTPVTTDGISIGAYVKVSGTGGAGLRLRSGAGIDKEPRLLGMEAEVFLVKDGPQEADGFTWWFLEAPYDQNRAGWAASKYLVVVPRP